MLYVDADARMEVYEDKEGNKKSNLSLVASTYLDLLHAAQLQVHANSCPRKL
jgi:hypothetical protein